ncbi:MAG: NUDIX hydrolase [Betaproteobacteria bacterium]|nr:NUDIX hydrolase [Betaproteobacteria bacterium]
MSEHIWKPHVTVAAVVERAGTFLLVEEHTADGLRWNQPAGHLEEGESLLDAVVRETLEESAWHFTPQALLGVYQWRVPGQARTYLRFAFCGAVGDHESARVLDSGIVRAAWLDAQEIVATGERHRSPLVLDCVRAWQSGVRYPLDLLHHLV